MTIVLPVLPKNFYVFPVKAIFLLFSQEFKSGEGYHKSHLHILMFWKAFHKLTLKEKKKFLSITNRSVIMYLFKR